ncbi:unnamed protein product [Ixodes hexagonus]
MAGTDDQDRPDSPTLGRWAVGACEAFVLQLCQVLRTALALFFSVLNAPKIQSGSDAEGFTAMDVVDNVPYSLRQGLHSSTISVDSKKEPGAGFLLLPGSGMASPLRKRASKIPIPSSHNEQKARATPLTSSTIRRRVVRRTRPGSCLGYCRTGDSKSVLHSQTSSVTAPISICPKASASTPTPAANRSKLSRQLASSRATATVAPSCKTKEASDLVTLRQQASELANALVLVFVLIANMCISLVNCIFKYRYLKWFTVPAVKTSRVSSSYCLGELRGLRSKGH